VVEDLAGETMRIERVAAVGSLAVLLGVHPATALDPNTRITQYFHTAWRVQDGAFEAAPNAVAQTADGYIWIGTGSGLVKYDGARFDPWTPPAHKSLANPNVISLLGSSDGTLWIGTAGGLLSWKNKELRDRLSHRIDGIVEDRRGRIWVARARTPEPGGLCQVTGEHPGCIGADKRIKLPAHAPEAHGKAPAFRVMVEGSRQPLPPLLQDEVYRIGREMLRNAFRHAQAGRIEAEIRYDSDAFRLRVRDDGKGIAPGILHGGAPSGHWGLAGMHERTKKIGGRLQIWSESGAGTEAELTLPARLAYAKSPRASS
jgi:hypothetical protein